MKKLFSLLIVVAAALLFTSLTTKNQNVLTVYYFHATNRCPTCLAIEANTKKTLVTYFAAELKSGKVKFDVISADDAKNKAICEKYQAFGSKLVLCKNLKITENEK